MNDRARYKKIPNDMFDKIIEHKKPTILVFGAEWSGNASIMDSMMERVSEEIDLDIQIFKVDVEKQAEISSFFGINTVPTTIMLKEGEVVGLIKGFLPARRMKEKILELYMVD